MPENDLQIRTHLLSWQSDVHMYGTWRGGQVRGERGGCQAGNGRGGQTQRQDGNAAVCVLPRTRCTAPGTSCSFVQEAGCLLTARNVEYLADDKGDLLC